MAGRHTRLAADGMARTRLRCEVLVKLKVDDLLEQVCVRMPVSVDGTHPVVLKNSAALIAGLLPAWCILGAVMFSCLHT
jgi:hypothetical protein